VIKTRFIYDEGEKSRAQNVRISLNGHPAELTPADAQALLRELTAWLYVNGWRVDPA
jgi:hypothetical protein